MAEAKAAVSRLAEVTMVALAANAAVLAEAGLTLRIWGAWTRVSALSGSQLRWNGDLVARLVRLNSGGFERAAA